MDVTGTDSEVVPPPTELYVGENELYCCPRRNPTECTTVVHAGLKVRKTYGIQQYGIGLPGVGGEGYGARGYVTNYPASSSSRR